MPLPRGSTTHHGRHPGLGDAFPPMDELRRVLFDVGQRGALLFARLRPLEALRRLLRGAHGGTRSHYTGLYESISTFLYHI